MKLPNIAVSFLKSPTPICYWIRNTEVNRYCCIFRKINNIFFRSSFWGIFFLQYKHVSVMFRHSSWPISMKKNSLTLHVLPITFEWKRTQITNGDRMVTRKIHTTSLVFICTYFFLYSLPRPRVLLHYFFSITGWSAAPQTTLRGGPGPGFEPGTGDLEAGTLTTRLH